MVRKPAIFLIMVMVVIAQVAPAQFHNVIQWTPDASGIYQYKDGNIVTIDIKTQSETLVIRKSQLTSPGGKVLSPAAFDFSNDRGKLLLFTNTAKVWRYNTKGDYWVLDIASNKMTQLGKGKPSQSLMFAKFSPDSKKVAYVSEHNLFVEAIASNAITQLTFDGTRKKINGTFDWAYEEEFFCRDGFRWSPDSRQIAYWQIDAKNTKDYSMLNTTDSIYPTVIPVEYPVAGEAPSPYKIGVVNIATAKTKWMQIPTDPVLQSYVPRMEWAGNNIELVIQHLNRKQNESKLMLCNVLTGAAHTIYTENDSAWIDVLALWDEDYANGGWDWLNNGQEFLWACEKDGWRHLYRISRNGKKETLITTGNYDVMDIVLVDEKGGYVYFLASPANATQKYLYRVNLSGKSNAEMLSPDNQQGTHDYKISPDAKFAFHSFSNYYTRPGSEWITLADHKGINGANTVNEELAKADKSKSGIEFFKINTTAGVEMDAWIKKPKTFDTTKKYAVVFYVYTEPWGQNVKDEYGEQIIFCTRETWQKMAISIFPSITAVHPFRKGGYGENVFTER
ncbi:MAG: DPP IV N-terminal domain-containing protein [Ferruginibacter sp.]